MIASLDSRSLLLALLAAATSALRPMALQHAMHALEQDLAPLLDPGTRFSYRETRFGPHSTALFTTARDAAADGTIAIEPVPPTQQLITCFGLSAAGRAAALTVTRTLPDHVQCRIAEIAAVVSSITLADLHQPRLPFPPFETREACYSSAA